MTEKHFHLEMIQGVVNRLSHNSFLLKGWSVALVSAMFALTAKDANLNFLYLAYFPAIAFWILDGYFVWQERLFRDLYDHVRQLENSDIDFSMDTAMASERVESWVATIISKTVLVFHGVILSAIILAMAIFLQTR